MLNSVFGTVFCVVQNFTILRNRGLKRFTPAEAASDRSAQAQCVGPASRSTTALSGRARDYRYRSVGGTASMVPDVLV